MLYTNVKLRPQKKDGKYGIFFKTCVNDSHGLFLPVSPEILYDIDGLKRNLNIEIRDGVPTIVTRMCMEFYMILATEHDIDSPSHGIFGYLQNQNIEFIGRKYFQAQGGAEQCYIIKAKNEDIFRITWGDGGPHASSTYYLVDKKNVDTVTEFEGVDRMYRKHGLERPFTYQICSKGYRKLDTNEWRFM